MIAVAAMQTVGILGRMIEKVDRGRSITFAHFVGFACVARPQLA